MSGSENPTSPFEVVTESRESRVRKIFGALRPRQFARPKEAPPSNAFFEGEYPIIQVPPGLGEAIIKGYNKRLQ